MIISAVVTVSSCRNADVEKEEPVAGEPIRFEMDFGEDTRVTTDKEFKSEWEGPLRDEFGVVLDTGRCDCIGIFAGGSNKYISANAKANYLHNERLSFDGTGWKPDRTLYWKPGTVEMDFQAYYPYSADMTDPTRVVFSVQTDQSTENGFRDSYLIVALPCNFRHRSQPVRMIFKHMMSLVHVTLTDTGGLLRDAESISVTLEKALTGIKPYNLHMALTSSPSACDGEPAAIRMYRVERPDSPDYNTTYTFRALIPAQTIGVDNLRFIVEYDGDTAKTAVVKPGATFEAGKYSHFIVNLQ